MTDIISAIDNATGCHQCGNPLDGSPSSDFCSESCQARWQAQRARASLDPVIVATVSVPGFAAENIRAIGRRFADAECGQTFTLHRPEAVQAGELMLAYLAAKGVGELPVAPGWALRLPPGWTLVSSEMAGQARCWIMTKRSEATDPGAWLVHADAAFTQRVAMIALPSQAAVEAARAPVI